MDTNEEKIGYLLSKFEELRSDQTRVEQKVDNLVALIEKKFHTAELVFKILKFGGLAVIALLTFKFGDITSLWKYYFP